jgi:hypothetical protein
LAAAAANWHATIAAATGIWISPRASTSTTPRTNVATVQASGIRRSGTASAAIAPAPTTITSRPHGAVIEKRSGRSTAIDPASATTPASRRIARRITAVPPGRRRGR